MYKFVVDENGLTLLGFLRKKLTPLFSVKAIKRAIDAKQCKINGRVEFFSTHPVKIHDQIEIFLIQQGEKVSLSSPVLYEDDELLIVNKPAGKTTESYTGLFLVHRLDKETSGALLLAKTEKMQQFLIALFAERKMEKEYLALCDGKIGGEKWKVDNYLGQKVAYQGGILYGPTSKEKGKRAVTFFECLKTSDTASLVLAKPVTGRTHQVRVHLQERGHPILGDWHYGRHFRCPLQPPRHMLHAIQLSFSHPFSGELIRVKAPLPMDFLEVQKKLFGA